MGGSSSTNVQIKSFLESVQNIITNIITDNSSTIGNTIRTEQRIKLIVGGNISCPVKLKNSINTNAKFVSSITSQTSAKIQNQVESELKNKVDQMVKIVRGFLSGIGARTDDSITQELVTRAQQIIMNNITNQQLNKTLNEVYTIQGIDVKVDGDIAPDKNGSLCDQNYTNDAFIQVISENVINTMMDAFVDDKVIQRITNEAKQTVVKEEKGLDSLLSGLVWIIVALIILVAIVGKQGLAAITNPKLYIVLGIGLLITYLLKVFPFQKKQSEFWGCEKDKNGISTGKCAQYNDSKLGPFWSKELCETAVKDHNICDYWGCEIDPTTKFYTGKCSRQKTITRGQYNNKEDCEENTKSDCPQLWGCNTNKDGFYEPGCKQYSPEDPTKPENLFSSQATCNTVAPNLCRKCFACTKNGCKETLFLKDLCSFPDNIDNCKSQCSEKYSDIIGYVNGDNIDYLSLLNNDY